ncbi:MAG: stimulus-sensing domain-containing protein [Magnetospirillum sp.]|nr:stimulus-sensing domain-containing protein [Magnetospirillum sp.]
MAAETPRRRPRWRLLSSPLTRRILAVNLIAPIILVVGVLYHDRYRQGLVRTELAALVPQAEMVAAAVGEAAVHEEAVGFLELNSEQAQMMVRRLAEPARLRLRLFDEIGAVAADSRFLKTRAGVIQIEALEQPQARGWRAALERQWERLSTWMPADPALPLYIEHMDQRADHYSEAMTALAGRVGTMVRARPGGGLMLSVAVPVQRYKQVVGALMVSTDGTAIARSLFQVRLAIVQVFGVALLITVAVSLYFAGTVARPIRRLAMAAEQVRHGHGRHRFPDLSQRDDEIGELSVAFREMTEALWRRMDAIEAFAADVAHEIKNPLTSVRSAVETAARISDPAQQQKLLAIIQDDVERLNRLISDISDASRIDAELSRAETEPVALKAIVETLAEVYRATNEHLVFTVAVSALDPLVVPGIEGRLVQVLRNLIANAVSFSPDGGTIALAAERDGKFVRLTVEDDGPGIPPDKLEAIFTRFYSERPEGEKFGTHSGLGLSISQQIVEAHGGALWAENRPAGGARFVVRLPAG